MSSTSDAAIPESVKSGLAERCRLWRSILDAITPIDRPAMEKAIVGIYSLLEQPPPLIVWCESPWQIMAMYAALDKEVGREWIDRMPRSAAPEPRSALDFQQFWRKMWIQIDAQIPRERRYKLIDSIGKPVPDVHPPPNWLSPFMPGMREGLQAGTSFHQRVNETRRKLNREASGVCRMRYQDDPAFAELNSQYNLLMGNWEQGVSEQMRLDLTLFSHSGMDLQLFTQFNRENILNLGIEALKGNLHEEFNRICKPDQVKSFEFVISLIVCTTMFMMTSPFLWKIFL